MNGRKTLVIANMPNQKKVRLPLLINKQANKQLHTQTHKIPDITEIRTYAQPSRNHYPSNPATPRLSNSSSWLYSIGIRSFGILLLFTFLRNSILFPSSTSQPSPPFPRQSQMTKTLLHTAHPSTYSSISLRSCIAIAIVDSPETS